EVKSAAYLQSWAQKKLSTIQFNIKPTHSWDDETESRSLTKARQADVYIFCVLHHTDKATVDPLNLDQWRFYLLSTKSLNKAAGEKKSISLSTLKKRHPIEATYSEIKAALQAVYTSA
ncbi:MAG: hypothetical protein KDE51_16585, partial [Anaerolineales bacterium]|nr:hypothetical protein [Anaerolineales bacterium]